jgi:3-hydroxyacyl-CoA dehydrogenase
MVIGHHFFSPANVMRLLEIVRARQTKAEVIATSMSLARKLKKVGVLVGNCRGFVGKPHARSIWTGSSVSRRRGAEPQDVDKALYDFRACHGTAGDG